jgi:hypothetical protein
MVVVWLFLILNLTLFYEVFVSRWWKGSIGDAVARVHRNSASLSTDLKRS